jgi:hypothetical protein
MKRLAASLLLAAMCACKKHEDASVHAESTATVAPATSVVATPAPSETASASPSSSAEIDPRIAREQALEQARSAGILGLIGSEDGGHIASVFGRDSTLGNDPLAGGNMWGDAIGAWDGGAGGLGLVGTGSGGGGQGEGIGLGNIGTIGHGSGTGTGSGYGSGMGRLGGARSGHSPKIRQGTTTVNGRLPPEVIQRIVRQNFGRFRLCYEQGLLKDPKLAGTVATKFVIDAQGAVSTSSREASTTMTDATVVSCINRAFSNLSFPQPEGGIVVVVYPVILEPGDP